jgi:hypothetical protein
MNGTLRNLVMALATLAAIGCSDDDGQAGPRADQVESESAFLIASVLYADDGSSQAYMLVLPELEGEVDLKDGIELPGQSSVFSGYGAVFVGNPEDLTVTRWELGPNNQLEEGKRISLAGEGVAAVNLSLFFVIDEQRAYYVDSSTGQVIVWNPSKMEIEESVPLLDLQREGFTTNILGYNEPTDWLLRDKGVLYLPVTWENDEELTGEHLIALLSIDAKDPTKQTLHTSDCGAVSDEGMVLGLDGNIYLAGTNNFTILHEFSGAPESALAKFDMETQAFDEDFCKNLPELVDGHEVGTLIAYSPGEFVMRAVDKSLTEVKQSDTYWEDIEHACRIYQGKIDEDGQLSLEEQPELATMPNYCWGWIYKIDGVPYFTSTDAMYKWDGTSLVQSFTIDGYVSAFERIR